MSKKILNFATFGLLSFIPGKVGKIIRATALVVAGVISGQPGLIMAGISMGLSALAPKPRVSPSTTQRLHASLIPDTPRVLPVGITAAGTDVRYEAYTGASQDYYHQIVAAASNELKSVDELWFDSEMAWSAAGGVTSKYSGYLTVAVKNPGTAGNAVDIDSNWSLAGQQRLTGCCYLYLKFKLTGNSKKAESPFAQSIPTRITIRSHGALLPDLREGANPDDQSTWDWFSDDSGRNPAMQLLGFYLGWRINDKLAVGCGLPSARIDLDSFITAANMCDEPVTLAVGGTAPRYRSDGIISEGDDRTLTIGNLCAAMNAIIRDDGGRISVHVMHNDLATPVCELTEADVLGDEHWLQTPGADDFFNIIRGRYVDATDAGLYQLVDYPAVSIDSLDGIDRIDTFDLAFVQSASQAQRLAMQRLQRNQYQGVYSARFNYRAWQANLGSVVSFSHVSLGWADKVFRVASQSIGLNGVVTLALQEENDAIYAWDADERPAVVAAVPTAYDATKSPVIVAIGEPTEFYDSFNYVDATAMSAFWDISNPSQITMVTSPDTGGRAAQVGDNSGNDYTLMFYRDWLPYSPEDLYRVSFDIDTQAAASTTYLWLGVQAVDRGGNNLGNSYNYVAALAVREDLNTGRRTYEGYMRGTAAITGGQAPAPQSAPVPLPDGSAFGFGLGGTVRIRPVALIHYLNNSGRSVLHQMEIRKVDDVTINWRGTYSGGTEYFQNDGVYYLGRSFGAKVKTTGNTPPSTATSDSYWFLIADKGTDGTNGTNGVNAKTIEVNSDREAFTFDGGGNLSPGTQSAVVTANPQNFVGGNVVWSYADNLGTSSATLAGLVTATSTNVRTVPSSAFTGTPTRLWLRVTATGQGAESGLSDGTTIMRLQDGSNVLNIAMTNDAHNVPTDSSGGSGDFSGAHGQITVFYGTQNVTAAATLSEVSETNCTGEVNTATNTPIGSQPKGYYRVTAMSADSANYRVRAIYDPGSGNVTVERDFTLAKARAGTAGAPGTDGSDGSDGADGASAITVSAQPTIILVPSSPTGTPLDTVPGFQLTVYRGGTDITATASGTSYSISGSSNVSSPAHAGNGAFTVAGMTGDSGYVEVTVTNGATSVIRVPYAKVTAGSPANAAVPTHIAVLNDSAGYALIATLADIAVADGQTLYADVGCIYSVSSGHTQSYKLTYQNITDGGSETTFTGSEVTGQFSNAAGNPWSLDTNGTWVNSTGATKVIRVRFYQQRTSGSGVTSGIDGTLAAHT